MPITDYKIVGGYYTAGQLPQIVPTVNAEIAAGWVPYGSPRVLSTGFVYQTLVKGGGGATAYAVNTGYTDTRTPKLLPRVGWEPVGSPVALASNYFLQAYCQGLPYRAPITVDDIEGISAMGYDLLTSESIDTTYLSPSTPFGRSLLTLADAAALKALIPPINEVFRASFTTTGADAAQPCVTSNVTQAITFNTQQIPNATLGTLNNATGVFTPAKAINGILSIACTVRRETGGSAALTWGVQVETSTNGTTWTPVTGASRRVSLRGAVENNLVTHLNFATALALPAGTLLRFTQSTDTASANVGVAALATGIGQTTSAGFIFSLYTVD